MKKTGKTAKASKSSKTTKSKATKAKQPRQPFSPLLTRRLHEGMLIVTIAVGAFMLMSFVSFHASDPGWRNLATGQVIENVGGRVGAWVADVFLLLFGYIAYLFPLMIVFAAYLGVRGDRDTDKETHKGMFSLRLVGFVLMLLASSGLLSLLMPNVHAHLPGAAGGVIGNGVGLGLASLFNKTGATLIQVAIFLSAVTMYTGYSWFKLAPTFLQTFLLVSRWRVMLWLS